MYLMMMMMMKGVLYSISPWALRIPPTPKNVQLQSLYTPADQFIWRLPPPHIVKLFWPLLPPSHSFTFSSAAISPSPLSAF